MRWFCLGVNIKAFCSYCAMIMPKLGVGNVDHMWPCPKCTRSPKNKISRTMIGFVFKVVF